jgi:hypothetical protein
MVTPEALRAALATHPTVRAACLAAGCSLQWASKKPELRAVLAEHRASRPAPLPRDASRHLGRHGIALPAETVQRIDAARARLVPLVGARAASRSAVARAMLATFDGPLPAPDDSPGEVQWLDLGAAWDDVGKAAETDDPRQIAGIVRAMLARPLPAPRWAVMAASARNHGQKKKDAKEA